MNSENSRPVYISEETWNELGAAGIELTAVGSDGTVTFRDSLGYTFEHDVLLTLPVEHAEQILRDALEHPWYALLEDNRDRQKVLPLQNKGQEVL